MPPLFLLAKVALLALAACALPAPQPRAPSSLPTTVLLGDGAPSTLPAVAARRKQIAAALDVPPFVLTRPGLDAPLDTAQRAVLADPRLQSATRTAGGTPLRAEVMAVAPVNAGDIPAVFVEHCARSACVRVVTYVYPTDTTITALVAGDAVLDVQTLPGAQPELPAELAALAVAIATSDPQLTAAFDGLEPTAAMAAMSAAKTTLEGTACERRNHLCVAPVFTWGDAALWTIVDLTDFTLVAATTWTEQGDSGRRRVYSEATLQDAALAPLCETPQRVEREGWTLTYQLTSSDGLELRDVVFQGQPLVSSIKVVDWHVGYAGSDGRRVGFSDAIGCPAWSSAAVIPYGPPRLAVLPDGGFELAITFRSPDWPQPCNYQYSFSARFGGDGTLAATAANEGRGCGVEGVYHPVIRVEPAAATGLTIADTAGATTPGSEGLATWSTPDDQAILFHGAHPVAVAPIWGDAELAYVYWTEARPAEGQGDLPSIGGCCALDANQGPEQFVGPGAPESLTRPVLWFVPRIRNQERARCWADTSIVGGELVPQIWPCSVGLKLSRGEITNVTPAFPSRQPNHPGTAPAP